MAPRTNKLRFHQPKSITRSSVKNSIKYLYTSLLDGVSGVPKLTSKMLEREDAKKVRRERNE